MQFRLISMYNGLIFIEAGIAVSVAFGLMPLDRLLVLASDNFRTHRVTKMECSRNIGGHVSAKSTIQDWVFCMNHPVDTFVK